MHPGFDKDYRYLLSRLIPRHLLSSRRVEGVLNALASNDRQEMIREAYLSLEELTERGVFRREGLKYSDDSTSISYVKVGQPTKITIEMTRGEWDAVSGGGVRAAGILSSVLAGIISSLSLNDSQKTLIGKIAEVIKLIDHIHHGASGNIILLRDIAAQDDGFGERIKVLSWSELSANRFYRSCMTSGLSHTFLKLTVSYYGRSLFEIAPQTKSILLVPLVSEIMKWGILEIHFRDEDAPGRNAIFNFSLVGQGVVRILENNEQLEKMVAIDRLTQVHNRNYYESQLPLEIERANRDKKSLAFLIIDIDDFKGFNDRFGHDVGDRVLKYVAQTVKKHLRKIDLLFRYGGEEFIALLPGAGRDAAARTAERIREVVSKSEILAGDGGKERVTISIGGCIYPVDARNEIDLFHRADQSLLLSKRKGKNRIEFYGS